MNTIQLLKEIEEMDSCFQKKYFLIKICIEYNPAEESLENNLQVFYKFLCLYMILKANFKKKDDRISGLIQKYLDYVELIREGFKNHSQHLKFQLLYLYIGIMKSDHTIIKKVHNDILLYMDYHVLKTGIIRDAMEHDNLSYQIENLMDLCSIYTLLQKYGYYHFDYLNYTNIAGGYILKSFLYLKPFIVQNKIHYMFLHTIFESDKDSKNFGQKWDSSSAKELFQTWKHLNKKIEAIANLF